MAGLWVLCGVALVGALVTSNVYAQVIRTSGDLSSELPSRSTLQGIDAHYVNPGAISYPFPSRGQDLPQDVYWQATGHGNGSNKRDLNGVRFNSSTNKWTSKLPARDGLEGDARRLIWDVPVYAPADGIVLSCWRVALDGDDPAEDGCGNNPANPNVACKRPGGGNMVRLWVPTQNRLFLLAHFREGSIPESVCSHGRTEMANSKDKSGAFGVIPETVNPFPWPQVKEGDLLGRVGNSGRSGGPHLHVDLQECSVPLRDIKQDCHSIPMRFSDADIATKPDGRNVVETDWVQLNGPISVATPRRLIRPDPKIGGFVPPANLTVQQVTIPDITLAIDAVNSGSPVSDYSWQVLEPNSESVFKEHLTTQLSVKGNCPGGINSITVNSTTGSEEIDVTDGEEVVSIDISVMSASRQEVESLCLDFAFGQSNNSICNQNPEVCNQEQDWEVSASKDDINPINLTMQCLNGTEIDKEFSPSTRLICGLLPFGFQH
ncbi:hypothetical protein GCM10025791_19910 [Halioxenophilus aromaticivorans]|uniref:Peptidase M23 domain-containing protein n=2 Tax=Halioxenophilus aromaticivorans TaxID=1306992 RepID=A0AAV3U2C5_9ALTE